MLNQWNTLDRHFDNELRLVNRLFRDFEARPRFEQALAPRVDVVEIENGFELTAEVPGYKPEEVEVTVHDGVLTIAGRAAVEAKSEGKTEGEADRKVVYRERRRSSFSRSFKLGDSVDAEKIEASVRDGLLTVLLPKAEEPKPRQIAIKTSQ